MSSKFKVGDEVIVVNFPDAHQNGAIGFITHLNSTNDWHSVKFTVGYKGNNRGNSYKDQHIRKLTKLDKVLR